MVAIFPSLIPFHCSNPTYDTMSSLVHNIFYFMGFLEYSGPKAGDREAVTGSEVYYGDWSE